MVEPYKEGLNRPVKNEGWGIKKFNLDDLYVRFFRIAERRIVETGRGVVCYISNFSYLGDPSFVVMRQRFLTEFDKLWFDCMNGDSRETGKLTPDGKPDPSVFSTELNKEGIRVGTTIGLMVRKDDRLKFPIVRFRHFWGIMKRLDLLDSLKEKDLDRSYIIAQPDRANRFSFRPYLISDQYINWPQVIALCAETPISGLQEMRKGTLMSYDPDTLSKRMEQYFNSSISWAEIKSKSIGPTEKAGDFNPEECRKSLLKVEKYSKNNSRRYALYPFDSRWCYHSNTRPLWNRSRPALVEQAWDGNQFFVTRIIAERPHENAVMTITDALPDYHLLRPNAVAIPIRLLHKPKPSKAYLTSDLFAQEKDDTLLITNLSKPVRVYLKYLQLIDPDTDTETASLIWMHALAIGYSLAYLTENADGIRQDWPRIPLPNSKDVLLASAALGREVAALLDTEKPVEGVTRGKIRPELKEIAVISRVGGGTLNPDKGELALTAGWGHAGKDGVTMPGKGKILERKKNKDNEEPAYDVYLNEVAYWANIPASVWNFYIGGYQVIKKWLSYRERDLLGRDMTMDEVRYVTEMARRLAALVLLQPKLDANYQAVKTATWQWPSA